jgi:hypothetical protein
LLVEAILQRANGKHQLGDLNFQLEDWHFQRVDDDFQQSIDELAFPFSLTVLSFGHEHFERLHGSSFFDGSTSLLVSNELGVHGVFVALAEDHRSR